MISRATTIARKEEVKKSSFRTSNLQKKARGKGMKKTALVVVIIAAVAMMIGVQSAVAAKPTTPVTGMANGKVTAFGINNPAFPSAPSAPPLQDNASGPWEVVVHDLIGLNPIVNFSATCQVADVVYKLSYNGPGSLTVLSPTWRISSAKVQIDVPSMTVESAGTSITVVLGSRIMVDKGGNVVTVNINTIGGAINMYGNVKLFEPVP